MYWRRRVRIKNDWIKALWVEGGAFLPRIREKKRYRASIMVYQPTRRFDKDNLHASCKLVIDALRELNFIYNDSPKWLDLDIQQDLDHDNPRVEISIEELIELKADRLENKS
jgi:Holliday junction resolvase RusA-like endonuclease